eukprot:5218645-Pleurochrysis_carterae.AAC.1
MVAAADAAADQVEREAETLVAVAAEGTKEADLVVTMGLLVPEASALVEPRADLVGGLEM